MNWTVIIYGPKDEVIAQWAIKNRTEQQAEKEAMHEVERQYAGLNWTLVPST